MSEKTAEVSFGDVVCLAEALSQGYVSADSDISPDVFVDRQENFEPGATIHNVGYACFTIVQKLQYSASKAFEKHFRMAQQMQMQTGGTELTKKNWHTILSTNHQVHRELRTFEQKIRDEMMTNRMEFQRKLGEPVVYGSVVQLKHRFSSKYLTQFKNRSEVDKLAMEVSLIEYGSEGSWWQVLPAEKLRRMGERVRYTDKIILENVKYSNSFLFVFTAKSINHSDWGESSSNVRFEVNASASLSSFQICHFASHDEMLVLEEESRTDASRRHLFGLDAITLYNREYDTYLHGDLEDGSVSWVSTDAISGESTTCKVAPGALWSVVAYKMEGGGHRLGRNSPAVLIQHVASGHYLAKKEQTVTLVPAFTGRQQKACKWMLKAHADSQQEGESALLDGTMVWLEMAGEEPDMHSWLACLPVNAEQCELSLKSSTVGMRSGAMGMGKGLQMSTLQSSAVLEWSMEGNAQPVVRQGLRRDNTDVMELHIEARRQVGQVRFLLRCKEQVKLLADELSLLDPLPTARADGAELSEDETLEAMKAHPMRGVLRQHVGVYCACMEVLIRRCVHSKEDDALARDGPPVPEQQELLRDMGVLQELVRLLRLLAEGLQVPVKVVRREEVLFRVERLGYKLLQVACVRHSANKQALLDHIPFLHSQMTGEVGAYFVALEVYRGTRALLLNLSQSIFENAIQALRRYPFTRPRMLELMIETCVCEAEPIRRNQDRWARLLFDASPTPGDVSASIREDMVEDMAEDEQRETLLHATVSAGDVVLSDPHDCFEPISMAAVGREYAEEFFDTVDVNKAEDKVRRIVFYLRTLDLLAVLVLGRNATAAAFIAANVQQLGVSYQDLIDMIFNSSLPYFLRCRACRLMLRLHIDNDPLRPINTIRGTRIWSKLLKNPDEDNDGQRRLVLVDMDKGNEHNTEVARFKDLVGRLPDLFCTFTQTDVEEKHKNSFVNSMSLLFHEMLRLGVYHFFCPYEQELVADLPRMRELALPMFNCLDGRTDFCSPIGELGSDSRFEVTDRSEIVMKTKAVLLDTLSMLMQCVQNKRVTQLMKFWESVLESKLGISKWEAAQQWSCEEEVREPESHPAGEAAGLSWRKQHLGGGTGSFRGSFKAGQQNLKARLGKMMSAIVLAGKTEPAPVDKYAINPALWRTNPPWEIQEIDKLAKELFAVQLLPEMSIKTLKQMFSEGMSWFIPEWIKIVLDLLRYKDAALKERAIRMLMESFSQQPDFIRVVKDSYMLVTPSLVELYYSIRLRTAGLQKHARDLGRDGAVGSAAAKECMSVMKDWRKGFLSQQALVDDSGDPIRVDAGELDTASLKEVQRITADLEAHEAVLSIIRRLEVEKSRNLGAEFSHTLRKAAAQSMQGAMVGAPAAAVVQPSNFVSTSPASNAAGYAAASAYASLGGSVSELVEVVQIGYLFLTKFTENNADNAKLLLPHVALFLSHAEVEGLFVDLLLVTMVTDNFTVVKEVGTPLVYAGFEALTRSWNNRSYQGAGWFDVLCGLVTCQGKSMKTNQKLMTHLFGKHMVEMEEMLMMDGMGWDMRIELMKVETVVPSEGSFNLAKLEALRTGSKLGYHLGIVKLLTVSSRGKSPSAEVFAANYFPVCNVFKVLTRVHISSDGEVHELPLDTVWRVKRHFVDLLRTVYVETGVKRLMEEIRNETCGMWAVNHVEQDAGHRSWMDVLQHEIVLFVDMLRTTQTNRDTLNEPLRDYMLGGVVPLLVLYYRRQYKLVRSSTDHDVQISEAIFEAFHSLYRMKLPPVVWDITVDGKKADGRELVWRLLHSMSSKGCIHPEWNNQAANKVYAPLERTMAGNTMTSIQHIKSTFRVGFQAMYETLAGSMGISDTTRLIGVGLRQMATMLSREGEVPLYVSASYLPLGRSTPPNPNYHDFIEAILDSTREIATSPTILIDIMRIMRAAIYVDEPGNPQEDEAKGQSQWAAFLEDRAVEKRTEPQEAVLQWVQSKFDTLGCTVAALRLMSHSSPAVQNSAVRLLITLLQGGNRKVQKTIHKYLTSGHRGAGFFEMVMETLSAAQLALKEFKKNIKRHKAAGTAFAGAKTDSGRTTGRTAEGAMAGEMSSHASGGLAASLGEEGSQALGGLTKDGHVMLVLRMVQLVCEGQHQPTQELLQVQTAAGTQHNIIRKIVDVLEALQPLLSDALSFGDGHLMCLGMQLIETLSEAVQGPHRSNQQALVNSNFLVVANRIFSSMVYAQDGAPPVVLTVGTNCVTDNDLRSFFKFSLLNCCLALLEAVSSPTYPAQFLSFFELRNIILQIEVIGRFLGHVKAEETCIRERQADPEDFNDSKGAAAQFATIGTGGSVMTGRAPKGDGTVRVASGVSKQALRELFSEGAEETLSNELFSYFFMLKTLLVYDSKGTVQAALDSVAQDLPGLYRVLEERSSDVEIVRQDPETGERRVELLFFTVSNGMLELTRSKGFQETAEQSMFDVPRSNPQEKATRFLIQVKQVLDQLLWLQTVSKSRYRKFMIRNRDIFDIAPLFCSVAITIMLLFVYGVPVDPNTGEILAGGKFRTPRENQPPGYVNEPYLFADHTSDPDGIGSNLGSIFQASDLSLKFRIRLTSRWESKEEWEVWPEGRFVTAAMGAVHLFLTITMCVNYLVHDLPMVMKQALDMAQRKTFQHEQAPASAVEDRPRQRRGSISGGDGGRKQHSAAKRLPPVPQVEDQATYGNLSFCVLRRAAMGIYLMALCIMSVLGVLDSPLFFVFSLLDFFRRKSGLLVLRAVILAGPNLLRSLVLGMIVIICFGFYSYAYFSNIVNYEQELCHSPFQCVSKHILDSLTGDLTTVLGDNLGQAYFPPMVAWVDLWASWKSLVLFISIVFWVLLLKGIIQGQIIDAFAEKRNNDSALREDLETKCFVSSIDRFVFNKYPGEWEKRRGGKYAWHYLLFFTYLSEKDPEEFNGLENFVTKQMDEEKIDFLPINTFIAQQRSETTRGWEDKSEELNLKKMQQQVVKVEGDVAELKDVFNKIVSLLRWNRAAVRRGGGGTGEGSPSPWDGLLNAAHRHHAVHHE